MENLQIHASTDEVETNFKNLCHKHLGMLDEK